MKLQDRWRYLLRAPQLAYNLVCRGRYRFTYDLMPVNLDKLTCSARVNLLKTGLNLLYRRVVPYNWPIFMQVELTNFCNLHCPICPTGIGAITRKTQSIDPELYRRLLSEVGQYLLVVSLWAWGEPLLHPQLAEILQANQQYRFATLLSTNGQNLANSQVIETLLTYPPTYLIVAVDGLTDATHSQFRVGATLAPLLAGVHALAEGKRRRGQSLPILHMRYLVMKHSQHELPNVKQFAIDNGFDMLSLRTLSIIDAEEKSHRDLIPDLASYRAYEYLGQQRISKHDFLCQAPFIFPTVLADGSITACEQDYNGLAVYGHYPSHGSFRQIWFGDKASRIRRTIRDNRENFSFCRRCPYADRSTKTCSLQIWQDLQNEPENLQRVLSRAAR